MTVRTRMKRMKRMKSLRRLKLCRIHAENLWVFFVFVFLRNILESFLSSSKSLKTCLFFPRQQTTCEQMLRSGSWSSCTDLIDPETYIRACMQDMCGCTNTTSYFCICSTLSEFSRQCSHAGGQPPNWRTPQFCGKILTFTSVVYWIMQPHLYISCMNMANVKVFLQNSFI